MGDRIYKGVFLLFIIGMVSSCIAPYAIKIDNVKSLLVVDALLTDENASNYVVLTRTKNSSFEEVEKETGAEVSITDDTGKKAILNETTEGVYKTDSLTFRGETGKTYTLNIKTIDGEEFKSDPCLLSPVKDIDSVYYGPYNEVIDAETHQGLRIYVDSEGESDCNFYRWTYDEWWKFSVPYPKKFNYVNDSTFTPCSQINQVCWSHHKSYDIDIKSTLAEGTNSFKKLPVLFIDPQKSNRLLIQYYIRVKQMSISAKEYEFWNQLKQISEAGGDIFDRQPFQIAGNIHNVRNSDENVLGYFQVSGVKSSGIYITKAEADKINIPEYNYECKYDIKGPQDYPIDPGDPPPTLDDINFWFTWAGYVFVEPVIQSGFAQTRLVFALPFCTDCTLEGSLKKPDFWVDME
jgi:hypothetical protein